jgi:hypothetical protein
MAVTQSQISAGTLVLLLLRPDVLLSDHERETLNREILATSERVAEYLTVTEGSTLVQHSR